MSAFRDYAETLWELGYSIIPIRKDEKRPFLDYSIYREKQCDRKTLDQWIEKHGDGNIAIVPGAASGLCMLDLDIKNQPELLSRALKLAPRSPLERFGSKGLGIICRYNGQSGRKLYFKGKEIGEMIVNTVFVIPPSIHPETKKEYKWTGYLSLESELKEDLLSELPCPSDEEINQFEYALEHSDVEVDANYFNQVTGRNNKLKAIVGSYINKGMTPEEIAPLLVGDDLMIHGKKALFSDAKEWRNGAHNPLANAYIFTLSIFKTYMQNRLRKKQDIPQFSKKKAEEISENAEYSQYAEFFDKLFKHSKRDMIDGILKSRDWRNFWQPVGNRIGEIRSVASDYGLKGARLKDHFERYESRKKKEFLYVQEVWDGKDHIAEMMKHVTCKNMETEEMTQLVKHWFVRAVQRPLDGDQNTMILFQGRQGAGKDIFIENLCDGFAPYFSNFTDTMQEKDIYMQIAKNIVINISEFDKLNKKHPGMVKDLITRRTAQFRPSHMQHFEDFRMNASFIGSVNSKNFLTDPTGNRRFWVFEEVNIDWGYPKGLGSQVLAQVNVLVQNGFCADQGVINKMNAYVENLGPESIEDVVVEVWNSEIDKLARFNHKTCDFTLEEVEQALRQVKHHCGFRTVKRVRDELKKLGAYKRSAGSKYNKIVIDNNCH